MRYFFKDKKKSSLPEKISDNDDKNETFPIWCSKTEIKFDDLKDLLYKRYEKKTTRFE